MTDVRKKWGIGLWAVTLSLLGLAAEAKVQVSVTARVSTERFALGVGTRVRLNFGAGRADADGLFLGRVVEADGHSDEYLFLDLQKTRAYLVDRTNTQFSQGPGRTQTVLRPIAQWGPTCGAYALTHFWQQYTLSGLPGNEELASMMASERGRTRFLEENLSHYYLSRKVQIGTIMKSHGKKFGVSCRTRNFKVGSIAADFLWRNTKAGIPVIMEYDIGPGMLTSTYETVDFEKPGMIDSRLWIPRRKGERSAGGHAIVAAAAFTAKGNRKILVIDSDWDQPRIWDIDRYLNEKVAIEEMGFTTCGPAL
jgi:hypothetical protein